MKGREAKESNDLFFVCSLIEFMARRTNNHRSVVVNALGKEKLQHLYNLASVYHSENMDKLSDELIRVKNIPNGYFDNISTALYKVPTIWDIGKVYKRLILVIVENRGNEDYIGVMIEVYNSWISRKIEDFNSSMYYENPDYLYQSYLVGDVLT